MKRGFTLLELLVVVGIMGLLGTISIGGYRAMQRGMAERGVMGNVNAFVRAAYQRAQIDRQPTAIYFWNETLRDDKNDDFTEIVVGKAVAVRRYGRITQMSGQFLYDEFGDLDLTYQTDQDENGGADEADSMYLYPIDRLTDIEDTTVLKRSTVSGKVFKRTMTPLYLSSDTGILSASDPDVGRIETYAFMLEDAGNVQWKPGMAYGFEFARIELPHGFVFGAGDGAYSRDIANPVKPQGTMVFRVGVNSGNGIEGSSGLGSRSTIVVSAVRPGKDGALSVQKVGSSDDPTQELRN